MKILVTGGTGVIGAAAIPALLKAGHQVRLLSRHADRDAERFPAGVEPHPADLTQPEALGHALADCEAVLHIAGIVEEHPPEITFEKVNVQGTQALCNAAAAAGQPYFVHISSLGADRGASDYHQSKLRAEEAVRSYAGPWLILRPGNVYGPGDETLSMLLKMIRGLPAVPTVAGGDQPFQPIWYLDFGAVIARAVDRRDLAGQTLELAGSEITTTTDVLDRLSKITGRHPAHVGVPAWLAQVGASAAESLGGRGDKLLRRAGLEPPINSSKLQMLLEGSLLRDGAPNALLTVFDLAPTRLDDGLAHLADLLPEQTPGEGVGAVEHSVYWANIQGSPHSPAELIDLVCHRIADVMPIEFAAEPGVPTHAEKGTTLTGDIPGRGHIQVRLDERTETTATFVTLEGHPLAGVLTFAAEREGDSLRFLVEVSAQPSNVLDWLAMHTVGGVMQTQNWREVVHRVVDMSGGTAPDGVQQHKEKLSDSEVSELSARIRHLVAARQRAETERVISGE
jgi:NADH dehydrogenase